MCRNAENLPSDENFGVWAGVFKRLWKIVQKCGKIKFRAESTEKRGEKNEYSDKMGEKRAEKHRYAKTYPHIHMGFQQPVENRLGNFPRFAQVKYGYQKLLENTCGKRDFRLGKPERKTKK